MNIISVLNRYELKAVLFDLDGTLVDTNIDFAFMRKEMLKLAQEYKVFVNNMEKMDILGIIDASIISLEAKNRYKEVVDIYTQAYQILKNIELKHSENALEVPNARNLLISLQDRNIKTAVVTRNCREASLLSMRIVGIEVDIMIAREDSRVHKPMPEPVLAALDKLNICPERAVMVGDHLMDVLSGKSAGCRTIGFLREERPYNFFDAVNPDAVIRSLGELCFAINNINS